MLNLTSCLAVSESEIGKEQNGNILGSGNMRWAFEAPVSEGITIRLCVREGAIVLYASLDIPNPNEAKHERKAEITTSKVLSTDCSTLFFYDNDFGDFIRRRRQETTLKMTIVYVQIEGLGDHNDFTVNSSYGNVTFGEYQYNVCGITIFMVRTDRQNQSPVKLVHVYTLCPDPHTK